LTRRSGRTQRRNGTPELRREKPVSAIPGVSREEEGRNILAPNESSQRPAPKPSGNCVYLESDVHPVCPLR
jgi:hypothetical protein